MEARQAVVAAINAKTLPANPAGDYKPIKLAQLLGARELRPQDLIVPEPSPLQVMELICRLPSVPIVLPA